MTRSIPTLRPYTAKTKAAALKAAQKLMPGPHQDLLKRVRAIAATRPMPKPVPPLCISMTTYAVPAPLMLDNPVDIYLDWFHSTQLESIKAWNRYVAALYGVRL
jgi:hypothetical protein